LRRNRRATLISSKGGASIGSGARPLAERPLVAQVVAAKRGFRARQRPRSTPTGAAANGQLTPIPGRRPVVGGKP